MSRQWLCGGPGKQGLQRKVSCLGGKNGVRGCPVGPPQQVTVAPLCFCIDRARTVHGTPNDEKANMCWTEGQRQKTHTAQKAPILKAAQHAITVTAYLGKGKKRKAKTKNKKQNPQKQTKKLNARYGSPSLRLSPEGWLLITTVGAVLSPHPPCLCRRYQSPSLTHKHTRAKPFTLFPRAQTLALLGKICAEHCGY